MDKYLEIKKLFEQNEDKENAIAMAKYMRNLFEFYGLATPKRKNYIKIFLKKKRKIKKLIGSFLINVILILIENFNI